MVDNVLVVGGISRLVEGIVRLPAEKMLLNPGVEDLFFLPIAGQCHVEKSSKPL